MNQKTNNQGTSRSIVLPPDTRAAFARLLGRLVARRWVRIQNELSKKDVLEPQQEKI